jgi:ribosomal protein S18 acetylase RimI-like enzyme
MTGAAPWTIRPLTAADIPAFRVVRLDALRRHPRAYGSSYEEEVDYALDDYTTRWPAAPGTMLGGFADGRLVGITGLRVSPKLKEGHKGFIYSVYVEAAFRGAGLATALVEAAIGLAREAKLRFVSLNVAVGNDGARRIYERLGFRSIGIEPRGLLVDGIFVDEELMLLDLD